MPAIDLNLISRAKDGDAKALEHLVSAIKDRVHHLALRMVADPGHAEDATQEILIRIITHLGNFRGESRFETWVYRVATNYLLTAKSVLSRLPPLSFDLFEEDLVTGLADPDAAVAEDHVMLNDLRIRCTMAMLLCLDPISRATYVLGDILEFDHNEAADILEMSRPAYRKRLSRARAEVEAFTARACGLTSQAGRCACPRRLPAAQAAGRVGVTPEAIFAEAPAYQDIKADAARAQEALATLKLQRATGPLLAGPDLLDQIDRILAPPT